MNENYAMKASGIKFSICKNGNQSIQNETVINIVKKIGTLQF